MFKKEKGSKEKPSKKKEKKMAQLVSALMCNLFAEHSHSWSPLFHVYNDKLKTHIARVRLGKEAEDEQHIYQWIMPLISKTPDGLDLLICFKCEDMSKLPTLLSFCEMCLTPPADLWLKNFSLDDKDTSVFDDVAVKLAFEFRDLRDCDKDACIKVYKQTSEGFKICKTTNVRPPPPNIMLQSTSIAASFQKIYVKVSNVVGGGLGIFAAQNLPRGTTIMHFAGKKTTLDDFTKNNPENCIASEYAMTGEYFDGQKFVFDPTENNIFDLKVAKRTSNFAPFINEPPFGMLVNAESVSVSSPTKELTLDIVASRYIKTHEEIYMSYNRAPSKLYRCGFSKCIPSPSSQLKITTPFSGLIYFCIGMTPTHNLDFSRISTLRKQGHRVTCFSFIDIGTSDLCKHVFLKNNKSVLDQICAEFKLQRGNGRVCLFMDYIHHIKIDVDWEKMIEMGFNRIILPVQQRSHAWSLKKTISVSQDNGDILPWSKSTCPYWKLLDSTFPLHIVVAKTSKIPTFTNTFSAQRVIEDWNITDEQTLNWIKDYGQKTTKYKIPFFKTQTLNYLKRQP